MTRILALCGILIIVTGLVEYNWTGPLIGDRCYFMMAMLMMCLVSTVRVLFTRDITIRKT